MRLFVFGLGYSAEALVREEGTAWSRIAGTVRSPDKAERLKHEGIAAFPLEGDACEADLADEIRGADVILASAPPGPEGDPALARFGAVLAKARPAWIGYLSTTGVYGDHGGAWIDETTPATSQLRSAAQRREAEEAWLEQGRRLGSPAHVFRLTGIYGPGRNALVNLARGMAHRVVKPGHVFNRIHVDDIAGALSASIARPRADAIYNVADDEPAPPQDVVAYAAALAGIAPPPAVPFEEARLSPMARSFYAESKRVSNRLIKDELGVRLRYPTYREGLRALYEAGEFSQAI